MAQPVPFKKPVTDSVPQVDNTVAVGEDLNFQKRWWRFERVVWIFFAFLIVADMLGLFGRGFLAKAERRSNDGAVDLTYERIERASTPSIMTFRFGPAAVHDGHIQLFVSQSVLKTLGAQRIAPQPASSVLGGGGVTYTFPATDGNSIVEIALSPSFPGVHSFSAGVPGSNLLTSKVAVVP